MKQFLALVISLSWIILFHVSANADYDKPIMFNGIEWGISAQETIDRMMQKGFYNGSKPKESGMPIWTLDFRSDWEYYVDDTGVFIGYYYYGNSEPRIAGYPLNDIMLYAHYDEKNGKLNKENTHYYKAEIWFNIENELVERAYNDLKGKLANLYGDAEERQIFLVDTNYTYMVWNGADNTAVCLYMSEGNDYNSLHLMYGITDCEETLQLVREAVVNSIDLPRADDINGL